MAEAELQLEVAALERRPVADALDLEPLLEPSVTPVTMFATSERVSPCSARWSPRSVGRVTVSVPSSTDTVMSGLIRSESVPLGPLTVTLPGVISTSTPEGTVMGFRPMRLIESPYVAQHLAAHALLLSLAAGDHAGRG